MFRIGLSMYLVLATVAGPSLCCCTPVCLADILPLGNSKSAQGAHPKSCCRHHELPSDSHREKTPTRAPGKPSCPDCPNCPCKQAGDAALPSQDVERANQTLARSFIDAPVGLGPVTTLTCLLSPAPELQAWGQRGALPFLSAHDFLTTFHILRC